VRAPGLRAGIFTVNVVSPDVERAACGSAEEPPPEQSANTAAAANTAMSDLFISDLPFEW
jgi:hypothetical protein